MLKDNKQMLLGVFVGILMGQYLGANIEGLSLSDFSFLNIFDGKPLIVYKDDDK